MTAKRVIKLLFVYSRISQMTAWQHRFGYFFRLFRVVLDLGISLIFINIIFLKTPMLGTWSQPEAFLIYALYQIVDCIYVFFCGDSFRNMGIDIRRGNLDGFFTKPVDSQFIVSFRTIFPSSIYRVMLAFGILYYALAKLAVNPDINSIIWFIVSMISAVLIHYALVFMAATTAFWSSGGEAAEIMNTVFSISKYPLDVFKRHTILLLTVIPLIFITTVPAKVLLDKPGQLHYFAPFLAIILLILSRKFWHHALRHYSSASS